MKEKRLPFFRSGTHFSDFRDLVMTVTDRHGKKTAFSFLCGEERKEITYRALGERVRAVGDRLLGMRLAGKKLALIGALSCDWICVYLACLSTGILLVPLDPEWSAEELNAVLQDADCAAVLYDGKLEDRIGPCPLRLPLSGLEARPAEPRLLTAPDFGTAVTDPDAPALLVFTSGTAGEAKGVFLSQNNLLSNLEGALQLVHPGKKTVASLPPHLPFGSLSLLVPLCCGAEIYLSAGLRSFRGELKAERPDFLTVVPLYLESFGRKLEEAIEAGGKKEELEKMVRFSDGVRKTGIDLRGLLFSETVLSSFGGKLKRIYCGGAPLRQELIDRFARFGITVLNGYGMTECSPLISVNRERDALPGSVGIPLPGLEIRIDAPDGSGEGEILVRGENVMLGYCGDGKATREAFDGNGFFRTGDIGRTEGEFLFLTGRKKNMIPLSNGENVFPEEIEARLMSIPGILEVSVGEGSGKKEDGRTVVTAEIFPNRAYLSSHGITDPEAYFAKRLQKYNAEARPRQRIGLLRIRKEPFPKNSLKKITRPGNLPGNYPAPESRKDKAI